ncbi:MAG TPA: TfoX/Sxy family protein [Candidatus Polarisedimenticolaceae bacterium]|nr:TfoX/Sxy family protein [Candidatus Polarisedimenticolaceae bacterium]
MAYDQGAAARVRQALMGKEGLTEKQMFGGLAFLLNGNMLVGVMGDRLLVRTGPKGHGAALARPHAGPMTFTGKPMRGFVVVEPAGFATGQDLRSWISLALGYVRELPPG